MALWFDSAGDVLLQWSPDGKKILFGIANGEVHVFDNTGNFIVSLLGLFSLWNFIVLMSLKRRPKKDPNERENSNSKTLFYKDCSLGSVRNLSNN